MMTDSCGRPASDPSDAEMLVSAGSGPSRRRLRRSGAVLVFVSLLLSGCFHVYREVRVAEVFRSVQPTVVRAAVRAHLRDGSVVVYPNGLTVSQTDLVGSGTRHDALRVTSAPAGTISMDSVLGLESYTPSVNAAQSVGTSVLATIGVTVLTVGGMIAIACAANPKCFGSCPTVYSTSASGELLEAELFSYSVAPLLEGRDVDLLAVQADANGRVQLEIRNEALETHLINHLELLEVRHASGEGVVPDARGRPIVLGARTAPAHARDRSGRDVRALLAMRDSSHFASAAARLERVTVTDFRDHIDLTLPRPAGRDSIALVLRLRNTLLNTVLFYDLMLGSAGAQALDWLGTDLQRIGPAVALGMWYRSRLGLWVSVEQNGSFAEVERLPDAGPIAWKDVAVLVPVPPQGDSMRVRLSFVTDEWRIDQVSIALDARRPTPRSWPAHTTLTSSGAPSPDALARLSRPDEAYLETGPGVTFVVRFETGPLAPGESRTFLLSSQGYYTEWVRPDWIRNSTSPAPFAPGDSTLLEALRRWRTVKDEFEQRFHETRIPVR
ncbi:MAG: hypothetical protein ACRENP_15685 [Longimicrobiales bacterium]